MISSAQVERILKESLKATEVLVQDDSALHAGHQPNNPAYLSVFVRSPLFAGKSLIEQHRLVYDSLKVELQEAIHAIAIKTAPSENA